MKYFFILNPNNQTNPGKEMNMQQKIFRKFFYENSSFIDSKSFLQKLQIQILQIKL